MVLVVIDGLDGSGKSTQALRLYKFLRGRGKSVCLRIHPSSDNFLGLQTRKSLQSKGRNAHLSAALFYMFDVFRSIILYSRQKYDYIVFVRYLMGTAYLPTPLCLVAYKFFATLVPRPDFTFFLDVTPEEASKRVKTRQKQEMFETPEELKQVRQRSLSLAKRGRWTIIDAERPIEEVEEQILRTLSKKKV
ncbi:MAG: dTMP kinase [Candidatus Bathyarchaeia archaeon]